MKWLEETVSWSSKTLSAKFPMLDLILERDSAKYYRKSLKEYLDTHVLIIAIQNIQNVKTAIMSTVISR